MRLSAGAKALVDGRTLRQATLWRLKRTDGIVLRFTDHDKRIPFDGETYLPAGSIDISARRQQSGLNATNVEGFGPITSDKITTDDLRKGLWRDAEITEFLIDWMYPSAGFIRKVRYWMTETEWTGEVWRTQVEGIARWLLVRQGSLFTRNCRHQLGRGVISGIGCTADVPALTEYRFQISSVQTQRLTFTISSSFVSNTRDKWRFGRILWTEGANAGFVQEIMDFGQIGAKVVECFFPTPSDIQVTDRGDIEPGCDKIRPTCVSIFNNLKDFGGFPFMPGTNAILSKSRGTVRSFSGWQG